MVTTGGQSRPAASVPPQVTFHREPTTPSEPYLPVVKAKIDAQVPDRPWGPAALGAQFQLRAAHTAHLFPLSPGDMGAPRVSAGPAEGRHEPLRATELWQRGIWGFSTSGARDCPSLLSCLLEVSGVWGLRGLRLSTCLWGVADDRGRETGSTFSEPMNAAPRDASVLAVAEMRVHCPRR